MKYELGPIAWIEFRQDGKEKERKKHNRTKCTIQETNSVKHQTLEVVLIIKAVIKQRFPVQKTTFGLISIVRANIDKGAEKVLV